MQTLTVAFSDKTKKTEGKITDRIKTFQDACRELSLQEDGFLSLTCNQESMGGALKSIAAYSKLIIIAAALNEGWVPDWDNTNQKKWYAWFKMGSGFGFSGTDCGSWCAGTDAGSRLCFKTAELAEYAGRQFTDMYQDFLTLNK